MTILLVLLGLLLLPVMWWVVMLIVGAAHSYLPFIPAFGFVQIAWLCVLLAITGLFLNRR